MSAFTSETPAPDSCIRLLSALHAYAMPRVIDSSKVSFQRSFKTCGSHSKTAALLRKTDERRVDMCCSLTGAKGKMNGGETVRAVEAYLPLIRSILLSCEVQPDDALLDEKLNFNWQSSMEKSKARSSEALMYEVSMALASKAFGHVTTGCDSSVDGNFDGAAKEFKDAAGVFDYLATKHLSQWVSLGSSVQTIDLPCEVGTER